MRLPVEVKISTPNYLTLNQRCQYLLQITFRQNKVYYTSYPEMLLYFIYVWSILPSDNLLFSFQMFMGFSDFSLFCVFAPVTTRMLWLSKTKLSLQKASRVRWNFPSTESRKCTCTGLADAHTKSDALATIHLAGNISQSLLPKPSLLYGVPQVLDCTYCLALCMLRTRSTSGSTTSTNTCTSTLDRTN